MQICYFYDDQPEVNDLTKEIKINKQYYRNNHAQILDKKQND